MSQDTPAPPPLEIAGDALDSAIVRVLMDTIPDRIYFKDLQSRFVRNNLAQARLLGVSSAQECVGKTDFDFFTREHAEKALADEQEIIRTGQPIISKLERLVLPGLPVQWVSTTKLPWRDRNGKIIGTFGLTRDVTAAKAAEDKLVEERNLLRTIVDHLPSRIYVKDTASRYLLNNRAHLDQLGLKHQDQATGRTLLDFFPGERGERAIADDQRVIASGTPIVNEERGMVFEDGQVRWSLTTKVPLRDLNGKIVGLVGISHDITRRKQAEEELQRRSAEMETDVRMARQLQESFLSRAYPVFPAGVPPEASALRFAHRYVPAAMLAGDFFDIVQLSDTQCGLLVCDVMGHGVRAGLLTALIRGVIEEMGERAAQPALVLGAVNHSLCPILEQTGQPVFATAFYGVFDTAAASLAFANAGHPYPLIVRPGSLDRLSLENPEPAAGLMPHFSYSVHTVPFEAGDRFLAYTDGLTEAADASGQFYGEDRLRASLAGCSGLSPADICERLVGEIESHCGRASFEDDVCLVAVESTGTTCAIEPINYQI